MMKFNIDRCDTTVAGWIFDSESSEHMHIEIRLNGEFHLQTVANLYRRDLLDVGFKADCGFSCDLNLEGFDLELPINIEIFVLDTTNEFVCIHSILTKLISKQKIDPSGWIFLSNDSNKIEDYATGVLKRSVLEIDNSAKFIFEFFSFLRSKSLSYSFLVIPDKSVACNDLRVERLEIIDDRPVFLLQNALSKLGSNDVKYLLNDLSDNPASYFSKTDTHLSAQGCVKLLEKLSILHPDHFSKEVSFNLELNENFIGDLGTKYIPKVSEAIQVFKGRERSSLMICDDPFEKLLQQAKSLTGNKAYLKKSEGAMRLLLFGSSSAYYLLFYLIEYFDEIYFRWGSPNVSDFNDFNPTFVLIIIPERFIPI
jgi:hypothetical protein